MIWAINEVSKMSGISVRTLQYYDNIGLLKPRRMTGCGYRAYKEADVEKLKTILMFRELGFQLKDIKKIVENPDFDVKAALRDQLAILRMKKEHIEGLILAAEKMMKGENVALAAFDRSEMEKFEAEVIEKWGKTEEYKESKEKFGGKTEEEQADAKELLMAKFAEFGEIKSLKPEGDKAQMMVKGLQDFISENFYECNKEILLFLGGMYVEDKRFRENIDEAGGVGTAEFVKKAIEVYCKK